jgi:hypothetical protein
MEALQETLLWLSQDASRDTITQAPVKNWLTVRV